MAFTDFKDLIRGRAQRQGLSHKVEAAMALQYFISAAKYHFDDEAIRAMKPMHVRDNILTIAVESPVLAQEIRLHEKDLISKVNEKMGSEYVASLRFLT